MRHTLALPMNCWHASICWCTRGFVGARKITLPFINIVLLLDAQCRSYQLDFRSYCGHAQASHAAQDCCLAMSGDMDRHRPLIVW